MLYKNTYQTFKFVFLGDEARVYELIARHFLACVSEDAVGKETTVQIDINGEKVNLIFKCKIMTEARPNKLCFPHFPIHIALRESL